MIHLGDIKNINGADVEPVDCICFGSPCQDLSVANGERKGLDGERSGLFKEAVRIIKEMRENELSKKLRNRGTDEPLRPRYCIFENVPGMFSSNGGEDFRAVLELLARIIDKEVTIPRPPKKWETSGAIIGDGFSIAWRIMDAQFYGVAQRRRRCCLVVDFNGHTAPSIVFEEAEYIGTSDSDYRCETLGDIGGRSRQEIQPLGESLSRNPESVSEERKASADNLERSTRNSYTLQLRSGKAGGGKGALIQEDLSATLKAENHQSLFSLSETDNKLFQF